MLKAPPCKCGHSKYRHGMFVRRGSAGKRISPECSLTNCPCKKYDPKEDADGKEEKV